VEDKLWVLVLLLVVVLLLLRLLLDNKVIAWGRGWVEGIGFDLG
jgi:hypothetical protein